MTHFLNFLTQGSYFLLEIFCSSFLTCLGIIGVIISIVISIVIPVYVLGKLTDYVFKIFETKEQKELKKLIQEREKLEIELKKLSKNI